MSFTSEPSKVIQRFVKTHLDILPDFRLTASSKAFLKILYNMALNTPAPNYKIISQKQYLPKESFPKGHMFDLLSIDTIKTHIINLSKNVTHIQLHVGIRIYNLYFVLPSGSPPLNLDICVARMNQWLQIATSFVESRNCSKQVDVYLYLTDFEKKLPPTFRQSIAEENVNTAFTTRCSDTTEILIFRREEWFKVFIHECFHNLGLDFDISSKNKDLLRSVFPLQQSMCQLGETYAELSAELLNIVLTNANTKKPFEQVVANIESHIQIERKYSVFQVSKILNHFGIKYTDLFVSTPHFKESTEVFCYYVLKTLLIYNCNDFIGWVKKNCFGLRFDPTKVGLFIEELIIPRYNQIRFIKAIDSASFQKSRNAFVATTMRMTALE
jgi:hypothetical protein